MGEVYRAKDTVLGREVALKALPAELAHHPERLTRLRREARILASLNHPGIATLFGLEESERGPVLVMEVVEGETLSDRLRRSALPIKDVLRIGQQVAEALGAAHDKGVLHRDLKPANVRLTKEGRAKVLDFGLATALGGEERPDDSRDPTLTSPPSRPGVVVGTAPYMSPEQARGEELDARTDVWAFGCLLYEMLAGKRPFPGATFSEVSAAILERDPNFDALPESTPFALQRLMRRCLRREKEERLHDITDAGLELRELQAEISSGAPVATLSSGSRVVVSRPGRRLWPTAAFGLLFVIVAVGIGFGIARTRRAVRRGEARQPRFEATLPRGVRLVGIGFPQNPLALSPDGQRLAFVGCAAGVCQIYVRDRREIDAQPLAGTEGAADPFFSPDSRWIGFAAGGKLKKVALDASSVVTLADAPSFRGGSWAEDGTILFNRGRGGLYRVAAEGGEAREVTQPDPGRHEYDHRWPHHLPGGHRALFDVVHEAPFRNDVAIVDLDTGRTRVLVENAGSPLWSPTGHLLFGRYGIVYAAPLDIRRLELTGPPVPVLDGVAMFKSPGEITSTGGNVYYSLASDGTLVFSPREARLPKRTLVWLDRQGRRTPISTRQMGFVGAALSRNGTRLAAQVDTGPGTPNDILLLDTRRQAWTKVSPEVEGTSVGLGLEAWMSDDKRLLLGVDSESGSRLVLVQADDPGPPEVLHVGEAQFAVPTPDGRAVLFCMQAAAAQWDIWRLPLDGPRKAEPFLASPSLEVSPTFSADGRFVAYRSDESGRPEVYVVPYPGPGPRQLVSTQGGNMPLWSRDGREIFFTSGGALMSAAVRTVPTFASEPPRKLFDLPEEIVFGFAFYDMTPDGQRFVMIEKDPFELRPLGLVIVPNWTAELQARIDEASRPSPR